LTLDSWNRQYLTFPNFIRKQNQPNQSYLFNQLTQTS